MSNSSDFKIHLKVLRSSADLQLYDSEFQIEGALRNICLLLYVINDDDDY